ncbi:hypothetical protein QBC43DRAFT_213857 [Cladorrhinum sp. PSN259]|nr:hypothetical protein QBC43DRAFT_213857 [Cladorrhinum sp. PSN259]
MAPNQEPNLHRRRTRICIICTEERRVGTEFPTSPVTATCNHPSPQACLTCISQHIKTSLESHKWGDIHCPECHELMAYQELARFADPETFARIEAGSVSAAIKEDPLLFECTRPECGYSQIHADGYEWPIFQCARCGALSCFTHNAPWHEFLTCEEYEISFEADNEHERKRRLTLEKQKEDSLSAAAIQHTAKRCPGCKAPIEKNEGCDHMTCKCSLGSSNPPPPPW